MVDYLMSFDPGAGRPQVANSTAKTSTNMTGSTIPKLMPVKITASGMALIDPSSEADIDAFAGVTAQSVINGGGGDIVNSGLVTDTGLSYAAGTRIFVSKSGGVTNVKPDIGVGGFVSGDWIISLGVVSLNESNSILKDVIVFIEVRGQL